MRAFLIWNPLAGQRDLREALLEAIQILKAGGWAVDWAELAPEDSAGDLARGAVERGAQIVIAAGGDGTVGAVAGGLMGTDTALAVFPAGTGNTWAKELGFPAWVPPYRNPLREAAQGLLDSTVRTVDMGRANGRHFLLWAGVGLDAVIAREVEPLRDLRRRLGNLPYLATGLSQAFSFRGTRSQVTIDGQKSSGRLLMALVSNGRLYGGGLFRVTPHAILDDGLLDLSLFRGHNWLATYRHFFAIVTERRARDPGIRCAQIRRVEIHTARPLPVQLDGEPWGETPLVVEVVPQALRVLVPPTASASLFRTLAAAAVH